MYKFEGKHYDATLGWKLFTLITLYLITIISYTRKAFAHTHKHKHTRIRVMRRGFLQNMSYLH